MSKGEKGAKPKASKAPKATKAVNAEAQSEKPAEKKQKPLPRTEKTEEELVDLTSRVYKLVVERGKDGVLQSEIWKELGLTSRDGSRLAIRLEKRGMIRRVKVLDDGRWTYKLTPLRLPANISSMESAPCIVCPVESKCSVTTDINPLTCPLIGPWVIKEFAASKTIEVAPPVV
ncbi:MAG TPA: MarR family winged helix-turn-helix transcriptional regulator [Nitrososphaerales archaeon]|nr:MarR family winged helix-turn-helix transcriptional regulator [Nitrososphaerales archaeon]